MSESRKPRKPRQNLTPEITQRLAELVAAGNYPATACRYAGISPQSFHNWMERGLERPLSPYGEFRLAILRAEAQAEVRLTAQWQQAATTSWQAARDYLARRHPNRWSEATRVKVEAEKAVAAALNRLETALEPEVYAQVLQALDRDEEPDEDGGD